MDYTELHLAKAERDLRDAENRLKHIKISMDAIEKEIDFLSTLEHQLIDNIRLLKKKRIVALANEYKKAKHDLSRTQNRLLDLRNDRESHRQSFSRAETIVEKCKSEQAKWSGKLYQNNVIQLEFGARK